MARKGQSEEAAERRVKALQLRTEGKTYRAIGAELGVSEAQAYEDVKRSLKELNEQQAELADEIRRLELERLDALYSAAQDVLVAFHPIISNGKRFDDLVDDGPKLAAIDRMLKVMDRRAKLLGLDAPTQVKNEQSGTSRIVVEYADSNPEAPEAA